MLNLNGLGSPPRFNTAGLYDQTRDELERRRSEYEVPDGS